jgi:hypothetical protein
LLTLRRLEFLGMDEERVASDVKTDGRRRGSGQSKANQSPALRLSCSRAAGACFRVGDGGQQRGVTCEFAGSTMHVFDLTESFIVPILRPPLAKGEEILGSDRF